MALHFPITADNRQLIKSLEDSQNAVKSAMKNIEDSGIGVENMFHRIERAAALSVAGFSLKGVIDQAIETRSYFQDIESSMRVFLGSQEKAVEFTKKLQDAAYYNMFEFSELADASKQLIAYRNDVEDVIPIINKLSEVATATKTQLAEMVSLYNRAKSTGTVDSNAIQSWATKGVVLKDIMKDLGVVTAGTTISFDQLNMALDHITDEGGMFHGIMDAQMENLSANIGQLEDNLSLMFNDIGSHLEGVANTGIKAAGDLVDHWQEALAVIATIAASYGINKAVEVGGIAINKASTSYGYDVELEQLRALLPAKEEEEQSTLKQAVASGRLSEAKALEIEETRKQVDALLEEATAREVLAKAEKEQADKEIDSITGNISDLDEKIEKTKEYMDSLSEGAECLEDLAGMEEYEAALDELCTLEREKNSAANELNSATERQNAAARNLTTASTERETLATQINTAQTAGNAAATNVLAIAKEKLAIAIGKVNKVIEANKFALITAAIIALGTAIYKLCTYQTEYEKSLEKVSKATNDATVASEKEIKTLDELNAKLTTTAKGSSEWKNVKDAIVKQFGQYIPQLDEEITKVGNLSTAYNDLRIAIMQANAAKGLKSFIDKNDNTEDVGSKFREALSEWKDSAGKLGEKGKAILEPILREYSISSASDQDIFSFVQDKLKQSYGVDMGEKLYNGYEYFLKHSRLKGFNEAHARNAAREREIEMYVKDMGISKESYNQIRFGIEPPKEDSNYKSDFEAARKAYEAKKAEVEKMEANKSDYTTKEYEEAVSALKGLKAQYEKLGGQTKDMKSGLTTEQLLAKEENAAGKLADVIRRQAQERLRLEQDYEQERWQTRINLMEDGEAKVLAQQELDFAKERTALERRKEQEVEAELQRQMSLFDAQENVKAAGNKKYIKKTFRDSDISQKEFDEIEERYKFLFSDLESQQTKAEQDRLDAAKESMNAYLKEFGTYQEKRLAIQEEYEKKISEAQNEGERMQFMANRNQALADLDFNEWQENGGMALAFSDIEKLSKDTISLLISDMEKYRSKIIATFDPEKIKTFEDALNNLRKAEMSDSFFGDNEILSSLQERLMIQKQLADEEAKESELKRQKADLENQLSAWQMRSSITLGFTHDGEEIKSEPIISEEEILLAEELKVKLDSANRALENSAKNSSQLKSQLDKLGKIKFADIQKFSNNLLKAGSNASSLASIFSDDLAEAIDTGVNSLETMLDSFDTLSSNIEVLAKAGKDVVKETTDSAKTIVDSASAGMTASAAATSASLSTLEKASAILAIIGAAIQLATLVASLFNSDKKHEKNIEKLQDRIDALQKSYDKLGKAANNAFSTDASKLINQQETLLKQQKALIRMQIMEEEAKKKTDKDKIKDWKDQLSEIDETISDNKEKAKEAIIGEDLKSAIKEFSSLYAEAWDDGTDAAQKSMSAVKSIISSALNELLKKNIQPAATKFYEALVKAMEDGVLTDQELDNLDILKKEIDALAASSEEQYKMIQERYRDLDEIKEDLTDISFDSVRDNFKSKLADMKSDASSFTEDFSDMLRNALIDGLMDSKYDNMLKEWYDEFAKAMDDQKLTDTERDTLRQKYDSIVQQGLADRDFINSIVGGGSYSQEASKGWSTTLTQDQGDELNGRFTALTELEAINNTLVSEGNMIAIQILDTLRSLSSLSMVTDGENPTLREIRDMMFLSTGHLEDISKYTKQLITIREGIDKLNDLINQRL